MGALMLNYYQSDYGIVVLSPWLAAKVDALPARKNGAVDMRFKPARRLFKRLDKLAMYRWMYGIDG